MNTLTVNTRKAAPLLAIFPHFRKLLFSTSFSYAFSVVFTSELTVKYTGKLDVDLQFSCIRKNIIEHLVFCHVYRSFPEGINAMFVGGVSRSKW